MHSGRKYIVCHKGFVYRGRIPPGILSGRQEQFRRDIQVSQAGKIFLRHLSVCPSFRLFLYLCLPIRCDLLPVLFACLEGPG